MTENKRERFEFWQQLPEKKSGNDLKDLKQDIASIKEKRDGMTAAAVFLSVLTVGFGVLFPVLLIYLESHGLL